MAQQDMDSEVFLFPRRSVDDYVVLTPMVTGPLHNLTVCLRSYTDVGRYALLTVGTLVSRIRNMFVILQSTSSYSQTSPYQYSNIYINNMALPIPEKADVLDWIHME
ncbi:hypothetical protein XENTR_v10022286 [Xenopus tropicalis]|nr:hypothetical protein XENTR_v10022286 [Xenopus tropicalis]